MDEKIKRVLPTLRLTLIGFFVALMGWAIGMLDRGNPDSLFVQVGLGIGYVGVVLFLIGFFWLLVLYLEQWDKRT